MLHQIKSKILE